MTIDELMEGKEPGSVRVFRKGYDADEWFRPYYKTKKDWWGLTQSSLCHACSSLHDDWQLYEEPKPKPKRKIVLREWVKIFASGEHTFIWVEDGKEPQYPWKPTGVTRVLEVPSDG